MEVFTIAAWEIWNLRNGKIFEQQQPTVQLWIVKFKEQVLLHLHRVSEGMKQQILQWIQLFH
uniref:Uncharacterized protein n=1 Tax=Arundo donax TaxID=35708 RepID=A0A0A9HPG2_ARUDO